MNIQINNITRSFTNKFKYIRIPFFFKFDSQFKT